MSITHAPDPGVQLARELIAIAEGREMGAEQWVAATALFVYNVARSAETYDDGERLIHAVSTAALEALRRSGRGERGSA